jgi:hypothetical protein
MPRIWFLVVCGLSEIMAAFEPIRVFISVDLPTLGLPSKATKPERNINFCHLWFIISPSRRRNLSGATLRQLQALAVDAPVIINYNENRKKQEVILFCRAKKKNEAKKQKN